MNKKDVLISYIIALPCIYFMSTLDYPADWNLPVVTCLLLFYPIAFLLMQKFPKYKEFRQHNEKEYSKTFEQYSLSIIYFMLLLCCACLSVGYNTDKGVYPVVIVNTPEKASEIQTLLTKQNRSTGCSVITDKNNGKVKYLITLSRYEVNDKQYKEAILELKNSPVMDNSVEIYAEE